MIKIEQARFKDYWQPLWPLFHKHYEELNRVNIDAPFHLDVEQFIKLEELGLLIFLIVEKESELIGYAGVIMNTHPFFKKCLTATTIAFYLNKEHRIGTTGIKMLKKLEQTCKEYGVQWIDCVINVNYDLTSLMKYLKYEHCDTVYRRKL